MSWRGVQKVKREGRERLLRESAQEIDVEVRQAFESGGKRRKRKVLIVNEWRLKTNILGWLNFWNIINWIVSKGSWIWHEERSEQHLENDMESNFV